MNECLECGIGFESGDVELEACGCTPEWLGATHTGCCTQCREYIPAVA